MFGTTMALAAALAPAPSSSGPLPYTRESAQAHLCGITGVTQGDDGAEVSFLHPVAVMASDDSGGPDKLFIDARAPADPADGSSSHPYPVLVLGKGGSFTLADGETNSCFAQLVTDDDGGTALVINARHVPGRRQQPHRANERLPVFGHTAFAAELARLPLSSHYYSYHRDTHSEMLVMLPASLSDRPDTLGRAGRVSGEMIDGLRLIAQAGSTGASTPARPWHMRLGWQETGRHGAFVSLLAKGAIIRGNGHVQHTAIAMFDDGDTGRVVTDMTDMFDDNLASARDLYCTLLDVQRVTTGLKPEDRKSPVDQDGRYLGRWSCPQFGSLAIAFSGEPGQPMDQMVLVAAPDLAGPVSDGPYTVRMDLTDAIIAHVKPQYRSAFRAARPRADAGTE